MLLLRSLSSPSPDDAELNTWFHRRWGRENCIIWGRARHADFGPYTHTLSIRAVWGGAQYCHLNGRTIAVDDDNFLTLNHGRSYSTTIQSELPVEALAICFRPDLVEEIENDAAASLEQALSRDQRAIEPGWNFFENLHPHDNKVSTVLRFIRAHLMQGLVDAAWFDEQLMFLLARMKNHRDRLYEQVNSIALVRPQPGARFIAGSDWPLISCTRTTLARSICKPSQAWPTCPSITFYACSLWCME